MSESNDYLLVKADVLPEVFVKVMEAKRLLNSGKAVSVNEAVKMVSLSRSAYYKYKDSVMPFYETSQPALSSALLLLREISSPLIRIFRSMDWQMFLFLWRQTV